MAVMTFLSSKETIEVGLIGFRLYVRVITGPFTCCHDDLLSCWTSFRLVIDMVQWSYEFSGLPMSTISFIMGQHSDIMECGVDIAEKAS